MTHRHQGYIGARADAYHQQQTGRGKGYQQPTSQTQCKFHSEGRCARGINCPWSHGDDDRAVHWQGTSKGNTNGGKGKDNEYGSTRTFPDYGTTYQHGAPRTRQSSPRPARRRSQQRSPQPRPRSPLTWAPSALERARQPGRQGPVTPQQQPRQPNHTQQYQGNTSSDDNNYAYEAWLAGVQQVPAFGYQRGFSDQNAQHNQMVTDSIIEEIPEAFSNDVIHNDQPGSSPMEVGAWLTSKDIELRRLATLIQTLRSQNLAYNGQHQAIASIKRQLIDFQSQHDKDVALTHIRRHRDAYKTQRKTKEEALRQAQHQHDAVADKLNIYNTLEQELINGTTMPAEHTAATGRAVDIPLNARPASAHRLPKPPQPPPAPRPALPAAAPPAPPAAPTQAPRSALRAAQAPLAAVAQDRARGRSFDPPIDKRTGAPATTEKDTVHMGLADVDKITVLQSALTEVKQQAESYKEQLKNQQQSQLDLNEQLRTLQHKLSTSEDNISAGCSWGAKLKEERNKLQEYQKDMQT